MAILPPHHLRREHQARRVGVVVGVVDDQSLRCDERQACVQVLGLAMRAFDLQDPERAPVWPTRRLEGRQQLLLRGQRLRRVVAQDKQKGLRVLEVLHDVRHRALEDVLLVGQVAWNQHSHRSVGNFHNSRLLLAEIGDHAPVPAPLIEGPRERDDDERDHGVAQH